MAKENQNSNSERIHQIKMTLIIGYALIIVAAIMIVSVFSVSKTTEIMEEKVSSMTAAINVQLKLNIENYLSKLETTGTLIFATPEVYEYDAVNPSEDGYESLNTEDIIGDKLMELCIMENYVDFGIVYSNNHYVGKLSNGTASLFGTELYAQLENIISRDRTEDGWATGCMGDYKRIYYVKRVNENAVFVASFYTTELENVFKLPEDMSDVTVRLIDEGNSIIYSSANDETGSLLSGDIAVRIQDLSSAALVDAEYLITVNTCGETMRVICSVPTYIILDELKVIQGSTTVIACFAAVLAVVMGILLSVKITDPVGTLVSDLDNKAKLDRLTGIYNKKSFEEVTEKTISELKSSKELGVLFVLDVDNFKGVNDNLGHSYGDKVLANIGTILKNTFRSCDYLGRIGGDEFAVYMKISGHEKNHCEKLIRSRCEELCAAFRSNYTGDDNTYKISASIGAAAAPEYGNGFAELYKCADKALYASKKKGKDTYTIYSGSEERAGDPDES
ncbi:MAG: GGDEF domain-containing protein [Oscillospiraceae bacterium]|nr:GGDEF domain-containing protein [Oscillospiraceae bacterium]